MAYSMSAPNTYTKHMRRNQSIAFVYDTLGSGARALLEIVIIVSTVVIPSPTRAGGESGETQNENQDIVTVSIDGMYVWIM